MITTVFRCSIVGSLIWILPLSELNLLNSQHFAREVMSLMCTAQFASSKFLASEPKERYTRLSSKFGHLILPKAEA